MTNKTKTFPAHIKCERCGYRAIRINFTEGDTCNRDLGIFFDNKKCGGLLKVITRAK